MKKIIISTSLYVAFAQALVATLGSLYFSEIQHLPPCVLCWYQRICMYPLVILLVVGILKKDKHIWSYVLPLSVIGGVVALYQNLLYYGVISERFAPCQLGVSCTTKFFAWFGFITLPFLSLVAFVVIIACMLLYRSNKE